VLERDPKKVSLQGCPTFLLQLKDLVFARAAAAIPVREQKDEFTLVRRLKMWTIDEHGEMSGVLVNEEMGTMANSDSTSYNSYSIT